MDKLASNRLDLFKELIRYRFLDLVLCSLCVGLFLLPNIFYNIYIQEIINDNDYLLNYLLIYVLKIPCIMSFGLGVAGAMYFVKRLTFGEGASVRRDFFLGIRKNYKEFLFIYFLIGIIYGSLKVNSYLMFKLFDNNSIVPSIFIGFMYFIFMLFLIVSFYMQTQSIIYKATKKQLFINSIRFLIGNFFKNICTFMLIMFPFILIEFVGNDVVSLICFLFYIFIYFGVSILILNLFTNSVYDKTINKNYYPELVRRGLGRNG